jgi:hypothetical protein
MTIRVSVDATEGVRYTVMSGVVRDDELLDSYAVLRASPDAERSLPGIIDLREVSKFDVTADVVRRIGTMLRDMEPPGVRRRVAIAAPDDVAFGMARMFEAYRHGGGTEYAVFRDMSEARRWLGLNSADR